MTQAFEYYQIPDEILTMVLFLLDRFHLYIAELNTCYYPVKGIPQGSMIAPILYCITMVYVTELAMKIIHPRNPKAAALIYMDDTALINFNNLDHQLI